MLIEANIRPRYRGERGDAEEDQGGAEEGRGEVQGAGEQDEERRGGEGEGAEGRSAETRRGQEESRRLQQETEGQATGVCVHACVSAFVFIHTGVKVVQGQPNFVCFSTSLELL